MSMHILRWHEWLDGGGMESVGFELCMQVVMSLHKKAAKTRNIYMQEVRTLL